MRLKYLNFKQKSMKNNLSKQTLLIVLVFGSLLLSCTNKGEEKSDSSSKKENLGFEEIPNADTKSLTIQTQNVDDNLKLLNQFKTELEENDFNFEELGKSSGTGFTNCENNTLISVKGEGIRSYFAKSRKPAKNTTDFYPDFNMQVLEFPNEQIAREKFEIMNKALHSDGRFCNGKAPETLVIHKNEVFFLSTRAEMFRGYINDYAKFIEDFKP